MRADIASSLGAWSKASIPFDPAPDENLSIDFDVPSHAAAGRRSHGCLVMWRGSVDTRCGVAPQKRSFDR